MQEQFIYFMWKEELEIIKRSAVVRLSEESEVWVLWFRDEAGCLVKCDLYRSDAFVLIEQLVSTSYGAIKEEVDA